jgi:hypothetical protein
MGVSSGAWAASLFSIMPSTTGAGSSVVTVSGVTASSVIKSWFFCIGIGIGIAFGAGSEFCMDISTGVGSGVCMEVGVGVGSGFFMGISFGAGAGFGAFF